jgi:hypothetical protein
MRDLLKEAIFMIIGAVGDVVIILLLLLAIRVIF